MAWKKYLSPKKLWHALFGAQLGNWVDSPVWFRRFVFAGMCGVCAYAVNALVAELRPYNVWGLTYGALAALFMLAAALLGVRRRITKTALRHRLGKAQTWLQFHLYGGMLCLLLVFMHTGFRLPHGVLTWWLWLLSIWVSVSGLFGVFLQKWIPKLLSSGLALEVLYERIPELVTELRERANAVIQNCTEPLQEFYRKHVAYALATPQSRLLYYVDITGGVHARLKHFEYVRGLLTLEEQEKLNQLEACFKAKYEIDAHFTLQRALRWWLWLHVPASLVLLVLLGLHVFAVLYY
ncbi:MAG: hypothetical protein AAB354_17255 [candidate division KSB1 bacterium]